MVQLFNLTREYLLFYGHPKYFSTSTPYIFFTFPQLNIDHPRQHLPWFPTATFQFIFMTHSFTNYCLTNCAFTNLKVKIVTPKFKFLNYTVLQFDQLHLKNLKGSKLVRRKLYYPFNIQVFALNPNFEKKKHPCS